MPDIQLNPTWKTTVQIGTAKTGDAWTYAPLCAGIENLDEALNVQTQQFFFLCGQGYAHNEVTGMAPTFSFTGKRVYGDAAQDYIDAMKYETADKRKTSIKLVVESAGKTVMTITCDATVTDIVTLGGGNAVSVQPFNCTIALNGKPVVEPAA